MSKQNSWPFIEARKILKRSVDKEIVTFQSGFGPSGAPHIGTFAEVARTTMVMNAVRELDAQNRELRLICFSDDKDAFRAIPDNVPEQEMLEGYLGCPLSEVPNPYEFEEYDGYETTSYSGQNNARLRSFLDQYGFKYEFMSATEVYASGNFNKVLAQVADNIDEITSIVTSTMKEERRATYCPFMPIVDGKVIHEVYDWRICNFGGTAPAMLHFYTEPADGHLGDGRCAGMVSLFNGQCKLQWYVDWAMRWCALDVDYEMHGKDLIESARISDLIAKELGYTPPMHMMCELFLDEDGKKISKSKGNGMDLSEWWHYSTKEVLKYYMFQNPRRARKLHFDVIPQATEEYLKDLDKYNEEANLDNAVWHVHGGEVPEKGLPIAFSMLYNLVSITNTNDVEIIMEYILNYLPDVNLDYYLLMRPLVEVALNYYEDRVLPNKLYRCPEGFEPVILAALGQAIQRVVAEAEEADDYDLTTELTAAIYDVGKVKIVLGQIEDLRSFFAMVYEIVMGQKSGPRLPVFIEIYGLSEFADLLYEKANLDSYKTSA